MTVATYKKKNCFCSVWQRGMHKECKLHIRLRTKHLYIAVLRPEVCNRLQENDSYMEEKMLACTTNTYIHLYLQLHLVASSAYVNTGCSNKIYAVNYCGDY